VQIVLIFSEPGYGSFGSLGPAAALALPVNLVVMATPVRAAVAADNFKKDRLAICGLRVTLWPADELFF
jgi:hypothetical protein